MEKTTTQINFFTQDKTDSNNSEQNIKVDTKQLKQGGAKKPLSLMFNSGQFRFIEDSKHDKTGSINSSQNITLDILEKLYGLYNLLNRELFNSELPPVCITLNTVNSEYSIPMKTWKSETATFYELNIPPTILNKSAHEITAFFAHEMIHIFDSENGLKDISRQNRYHNKLFFSTCINHGLLCDKSEKNGYSEVYLSDKVKKLLEDSKIDLNFTVTKQEQ